VDKGSAEKLVHHLFAKCPALLGLQGSANKLIHILFAKCPAFRTFVNRLCEVIY